MYGLSEVSILNVYILMKSSFQQSYQLQNIFPSLDLPRFSHRHGIAVPAIYSENRKMTDHGAIVMRNMLIMCDKKACPNVWYHLACLKMATAPNRKWLCPSCHASSYHLKWSCTQVTAPIKQVKK